MRVVLVTVQRGRHAHLARQREAVVQLVDAPDAYVVVSMDPEPPRVDGADVVSLPVPDGTPLPLSRARNLAIDHAHSRHGADLVVLLDVDCLPSPTLLGRYRDAAAERPEALLAGAVRYLPPGVPAHGPLPSAAELRAAPPHPARPVAPDGTLLDEPRSELFWSLSFAVRPAVHRRLGGFDEAYRGYGGEDTDYARRAARADVPLAWVGGAEAYHQHHPVSSPPVEHLVDIVDNARRFRDRWGTWPMEGWLAAFAEQGLVRWEPGGDELRLTVPAATAGARDAAASQT